jgi:UDP-N-acetylmuramoyl-L-alanyl-D-glutamate--2,6-diaminopimelate ligase
VITDINITGISINSKTVQKGNLFIALKGINIHGASFIENAVQNGASALLIEKPYSANEYVKNLKIPYFFGTCLREKLGDVSSWFYGFPSKKLNIIGVTGTNGKTTICYFLYDAISKEKKTAGLLGTIETKINNKSWESLRTTLEPTELHKLFHKMVNENVKMCAMEISSQAISQQRINGLKVELAVFTNLSQDHLDYHKTMENYFNEKAKLFIGEFTKKALISIDDIWGEKLIKLIKNEVKVQTFSATGKNADWNFSETNDGFILNNIKTKINLIGKFNKIDAAMAIAAAKICGLKNPEKAIENTNNIPGRSEIVHKNPLIIIDYAHTPKAIKELLLELRKMLKNDGKLITLTGAGGLRDHKKRKPMSKIIYELSDFYVITDDNYRTENPHKIRTELENAVPKSKNVFNVSGRANGIKKALSLTFSKNDIIAILGKGHEKYIITNNGYEPYNDKETVLKLL